MKTLKILSEIKKWELTPSELKGTIKEGEKQGFLLSPHHPEQKSGILITLETHFTALDTDFLLDIKTTTFVQFDIVGTKPTIQELYDVYCEAKKDAATLIRERLDAERIPLASKFIPVPLDYLTPILNDVLLVAYKSN